GSTRTVPGKIETSEKGTFFLDDVTELPVTVQVKLLLLLHDENFLRMGGETRVDADIRLLAASDANIESALAEGKLREDLYYRLSAFSVYVPPLRQRKEDISLLVGHF